MRACMVALSVYPQGQPCVSPKFIKIRLKLLFCIISYKIRNKKKIPYELNFNLT